MTGSRTHDVVHRACRLTVHRQMLRVHEEDHHVDGVGSTGQQLVRALGLGDVRDGTTAVTSQLHIRVLAQLHQGQKEVAGNHRETHAIREGQQTSQGSELPQHLFVIRGGGNLGQRVEQVRLQHHEAVLGVVGQVPQHCDCLCLGLGRSCRHDIHQTRNAARQTDKLDVLVVSRELVQRKSGIEACLVVFRVQARIQRGDAVLVHQKLVRGERHGEVADRQDGVTPGLLIVAVLSDELRIVLGPRRAWLSFLHQLAQRIQHVPGAHTASCQLNQSDV